MSTQNFTTINADSSNQDCFSGNSRLADKNKANSNEQECQLGEKDGDQRNDTKKKEYSPEEKMFIYCEKGTSYHVNTMLDKYPHLTAIRDTDEYTPLHRACYANNVDVVKTLIERGADINAKSGDGWTPLHSAARWSALECASILVNSGADVNARSTGHLTPLHLACTNQSRGLLELLLHHPDIDVTIMSKGGDKAVDIARRSCSHYKIFEELNM